MNTSSGDFAIPITDQEINLGVVFENTLSLPIMLTSVLAKLIGFLV